MTRFVARAACALSLLVAVPGVAAAQADSSHARDHRKMSRSHHAGSGWKELDRFHELLAATYHPAAKDSLQPLRAKAADLASAATAWAASAPPDSCKSDDVRKSVATIATDAQAIAARVKANAPDAELKSSASALHELFETVEQRCGGHEMKGMKH